MYVGTVHSLCRRLITDRRFSVSRQRRRIPLLLDELAQYLYLYQRARWAQLTNNVGLNDTANEFVNRYFDGRDSKSKHHAVTNCIALFNRLSEESIDPKHIQKRADNEELKTILTLYEEYLKTLADPKPNGTTDLSLLQQQALNVLNEQPESKNVFKHVIIDEYQDTNPIQERLFFKIARGHKNICVVGDDDQGLYRFRGATVENFVQFPAICKKELGIEPREIKLIHNYRSRQNIVDFYNKFINKWDWTKQGNDKGNVFFRINKDIKATNKDDGPSVIVSTPGSPYIVCPEIAELVSKLIKTKKVSDPNQIAFVFPSLKSVTVRKMIDSLLDKGIKVYAPRAGRFLEVSEAEDMFAIFIKIMGRPTRGDFPGSDYNEYHNWLDRIVIRGNELVRADDQLKRYVDDRQEEIKRAVHDYRLLMDFIETKKWDLDEDYTIEKMKRALVGVSGLSDKSRRSLSSSYFDRIVRQRIREYQEGLSEREPFKLSYIIRRATAMDWSVLDLFYRICGFRHFKTMFDLAQQGIDEGPIANLGLISQYLERFIEQYTPMVTATLLVDNGLQRLFFGSYLFALYRRGESEYEDSEDPFPKGRIPFITIHQAKGLEFPVVVLGNSIRRSHGVRRIEQIVNPLINRNREPLARMDGFDAMRMFYVALSRAQNLLVIANYRGQGYPRTEPFASLLKSDIPTIPKFKINSVPKSVITNNDLPKNYSYTSDYLFYLKCPRQYMIFRKFGFVESRSTTMFFGNLVHETLADLHEHLISMR